MSDVPLMWTTKGNLPIASLERRVVWFDMETPIYEAKAAMASKVAALEVAILSADNLQFAAALLDLKKQADVFLNLTEVICNVEYWQGQECVYRDCLVKKLVGAEALGQSSGF